MKNTNKGITLIALVITIIIMLILVVVTINMAVNGGLFGYAQNASKGTKEAIKEETLLSLGTTVKGELDNILYGKNKPVKFVDYKNARFIIAGQQGNKTILLPAIFPEDNNYMISSKYKVVNGKKISASLDDPEAVADSSFEDFSQRIKEELDTACQEKYGTSDEKIKASNAEDSNSTIVGAASLLDQVDLGDNIDSVEKILAKDVEITLDFYEGLQYDCPVRENVNAFMLMMPTSICNNMISNQINKYGLEQPNIDATLQQEINTNLTKLLKKEITIEEIDASNDLIKDYIIVLFNYCRICMYFGELNFTGSSTHNDEGYWRTEMFDFMDGYTIYSPLRIKYEDGTNEDEFNTQSCKIAPVLFVDDNLLQRTGENTYRININ